MVTMKNSTTSAPRIQAMAMDRMRWRRWRSLFRILHHDAQSERHGAAVNAETLLDEKNGEQQEQVQHRIGEQVLRRAVGRLPFPLAGSSRGP